MGITSRKWTTLGLSDREDTVLKALMAVVQGKTRVRWQHANGFDVDLAFCQPESPLSQLALKRAASHRRPVCVSVPQPGQPPLAGTRSVNVRLRAGEFIALLDEVSAQLGQAATPAADAPPAEATAPAGESALAQVLRDLLTRGGRGQYRIEAGGEWLHIYLPQHTFCASTQDLALLVGRLLAPGELPQVRPLAAAESLDDASRRPLDRLLWACGMHGPSHAPLPWLPAQGEFRLRRWPDFGRLPDSAPCIELAALLVRERHSAPRLAARTGHDIAQVHRFLNACELIGLLQADAAAPPAPAADIASPEAAARPWGGVLGRIRAALRITRP